MMVAEYPMTGKQDTNPKNALPAALWIACCLVLLAGCSRKLTHPAADRYDFSTLSKRQIRAYIAVEDFLQQCVHRHEPVPAHPKTRIDTVIVDDAQRRLAVWFDATFAHIPFRPENTAAIYRALQQRLSKPFRDYALAVFADGKPIAALIPNFFRGDTAQFDRARRPQSDRRGPPLVQNLSKPWQPEKGLFNRNIALWPSHGWYYEDRTRRWEWQRARVFTTVEDLLPFAFVQPYLTPMLENAGANVFLPRERDIQTEMVIVDNDAPIQNGIYREYAPGTNTLAWLPAGPGFARGTPPYHHGENPFRSGTSRRIPADSLPGATAEWIPDIPKTGNYAVYAAYLSLENSVEDARYTVYHSGGKTEFRVNQRMGGGTWIYLGTFHFRQGLDRATGRVVLSGQSDQPAGRVVTADAVRFGGGMGEVERKGSTGGRPRFMEGARYYMQFAGMPDTLVYNVTENPVGDYVDDYRGRAEWVNYLRGAPYGPNKQRSVPGLGIPIDLSLAFHTDAGNSRSDTTIGTLMIVSITGADSLETFPDGMSRLANRDFGDILQTQIVADIRAKYDPLWRRRGLWNRRYSEAFRPNVPAALLELLSHHNFLDMKFALDPRFRFDASRAIYKGMLTFLATQYGQPFAVQPLPVTHFSAEFSGSGVRLRWQPQRDSLAADAQPRAYIVYTRVEDNGWDNGTLVATPEIEFSNLQKNVIYSYKVTAVNEGGESFPSEILAVCRGENSPPVLIVNGFDRVAPPAALEAGALSGFATFWDEGVPDRYDLNFTGAQFEFHRDSQWADDDAPGHGASHADFETRILPGNTFDFSFLHGRALRAAGFSFVSCSDEAVRDGHLALAQYPLVDLILGEEKTTPWPKPRPERAFAAFPPALQNALQGYLSGGGNLFLSGAYIGTDLCAARPADHPDVQFARKVLKYRWRSDHAARTGKIRIVDAGIFAHPGGAPLEGFQYNSAYHPAIYAAESPDALEPADSLARTILRYAENNMSAAIAYAGDYRLVAFGFPFETILPEKMRFAVMKNVLDFLTGNDAGM